MNEAHVIERLEFAVEFASEAQAFDAQPRLSAFLGRVATATIGSVFDEFSTADGILRLDRLEIDLGRVGGDDLEYQWRERLRERLRSAMQREIHLQSSGQSPDGVIRSRRQAQFEALAGFLSDGHWSWRVPERAGVDELALRVVRDSGPQFAEWLRSAARRERIVPRLVQQLAERQLESIVELLSPGHCRGLLCALAVLLDDAQLPAHGHRARVRRAAWEALIGSLLSADGSSWAVERAVHRMLAAVDAQRGTASASSPGRALDPAGGAGALPAATEPPEGATVVVASASFAPELARLRTQLHRALTEGAGEGLAEAWRRFRERAPALLRETLCHQGQSAEIRRRMAAMFSEPMLLEVVELFVPTERVFIQTAIRHAEEVACSEPIGPLPRHGLKGRLWEFTLTHLLVDRGSAFNRRSYIGGMLQTMAVQEEIDYGQLLHAMAEALRTSAVVTGLQREMLQLLAELEEARLRSRTLLAAYSGTATSTHAAATGTQAAPDTACAEALRVLFASALAGSDALALAAVWRPALLHDPAWVREELLRQGQSGQVRRRMAAGLPEPALVELTELFAPQEGDFVGAAIHAMAPAAAEQLAGARDVRETRQSLWEFTLTYLLVDRGTGFNKRSYVDSVLRQMAARESVEYAQFIDAIRAALERVANPSRLQRQMRQMIAELATQHPHGPQPRRREGGTANSVDAEIAKDVPRERLLAALGDRTGGEFERIWRAWMGRAPALLRRELLRLGRSASRRRRLIENLAEAMRPALLSVLVPQEGEFIAKAIDLCAAGAARAGSRIGAPARIRNKLWEFTLTFVLTSEGEGFNRRSYAAFILRKLAARDGIRYGSLLHHITAVLRGMAAPGAVQGSLLHILLDLALAEAAAPAATPSAPARAGEGNAKIGKPSRHAAQRIATPPKTDRVPSRTQQPGSENDVETLRRLAARGNVGALESALRDRGAAHRFIEASTPELLSRLLYSLRPADHYAVQRCADCMAFACRGYGAGAERIEQLKWRFVFQYLFEEGRPFSAADFARRFAAYLAANLRVAAPVEWVRDLLRGTGSRADGGDPDLADAMAAAAAGKARDAAARRAEAAATNKPSAEAEPIYIFNAGLVLVAPYLPRLLEALGLIADNAFVDAAAVERGIGLLQFAASGGTDCPETELVLNKLLCGAELELPVAREIVLTDRERLTVEELLRAMIEHWSALGSTSIAGLRESFLQREGRLVHKQDAWHLLVEPRAFDMLLDRLPWSFATIKYSWMKEIVHVDWR